jgi:hypothetical protein
MAPFVSAASQVTVCISGDVPRQNQAEAVAAALFARIGIGIRWRGLSDCPQDAVEVIVVKNTPTALMPNAAGYARPLDGRHAVVFLDRVASVVTPDKVPDLLGYAIAHEIAHVLEGPGTRHSGRGVMRERWSAEDLQMMGWGALSFTPEDVERISHGRELRTANVAASRAAIRTMLLPRVRQRPQD